MKKIVSGLLMGILCAACAKQETTYTIQGEWKDGDGNVIYLKKDLGNKQYEILDSAVVVNGVFKMQKPLGDVDECILQINGFRTYSGKMRNRKKNGKREGNGKC
mgnify:CR=1 FL=1